MLSRSKEEHTFKLSPDAWFACFGIKDPSVMDERNKEIEGMVRAFEEKLRKEKRRFLGREALLNQEFNRAHTPKKFSERMWCICDDIPLRVEFIAFIKELRRKARQVWKKWNEGDYSARYPIGLFPPSLPRNANLLPTVIPC